MVNKNRRDKVLSYSITYKAIQARLKISEPTFFSLGGGGVKEDIKNYDKIHSTKAVMIRIHVQGALCSSTSVAFLYSQEPSGPYVPRPCIRTVPNKVMAAKE